MDIGRFKQILEHSNTYGADMECRIKAFYRHCGMNDDSEVRNLLQIARPILKKRGYIIVEMPLADQEIGALCYKGDTIGYTVLNTSLPEVNSNFALAHEIYHVFYSERGYKRQVELLNEQYCEYQEEFLANLFARMLLMPEQSFRFMFHKFQDETETDHLATLAKLMSYFNVPYMATLIRCYELKMLEAGHILQNLLETDRESIRDKFVELWLDDAILDATKRDDYCRLEALVKKIGEEYQEEGYVGQHTISKALQNMQKLYNKIKGE